MISNSSFARRFVYGKSYFRHLVIVGGRVFGEARYRALDGQIHVFFVGVYKRQIFTDKVGKRGAVFRNINFSHVFAVADFRFFGDDFFVKIFRLYKVGKLVRKEYRRKVVVVLNGFGSYKVQFTFRARHRNVKNAHLFFNRVEFRFFLKSRPRERDFRPFRLFVVKFKRYAVVAVG